MFAPVSKRKGSFSLLAFSLTALTEMDCDVQHLIGIDVYPFLMESISWMAVSMHLESILIDAVCLCVLDVSLHVHVIAYSCFVYMFCCSYIS